MGRQLADLVQKQRAPLGGLPKPHLPFRAGSREGAFLIAEQLRFQQIFRNSGAVDFYHREAFAVTVLVDNSGNDLLAHSRFPVNHHIGCIPSHL